MRSHAFYTSSFLIILLLLVTYSCNLPKKNTQIIEGTLYFSWLRVGSFYNQPDSLIQSVTTYADTVDRDRLDSIDLKFLTMYDKLKSENLLHSPFIELKVNKDSIINLYLSKSDYDKIKIYRRQDLINKNKAILIKSEIRVLAPRLAFCTKLLSVEKVDGITEQRSRKFKIEDYY